MKHALLFLVGLLFSSFCQGAIDERYLDPSLPIEKRICILMRQMTLEEKVAQLCQYVGLQYGRKDKPIAFENTDPDVLIRSLLESNGIARNIFLGKVGACLHVYSVEEANILQMIARKSRLKIPLLIAIDAVHGNCMHRGCTVYPTSIGMASSFNPVLLKEIGRQTAVEMRSSGVHWTFNPNIELARDARWGRVGETFGEDTYLVTQMGTALILGLQGENGFDGSGVLACAKHFVGGGEPAGGINAAPMDMSEQKLRDLYLSPFAEAIDKAHVATVMPAHNELNGVPCHANHYLLQEILRNELGFQGFVISDWMDIERLHEMHHYAPSQEEAFRMAVKAGVDMHMQGDGFLEAIVEAVRNKYIPETRIDLAVYKILEAKFRLGLFENPLVDIPVTRSLIYTEEHQATTLEAARQSIVLLKNDNYLLPLKQGRYKKILVTGPNANSPTIMGDWTTRQPEENVITVLEGIQRQAPDAVIDTVCFSNKIRKMNRSLIKVAAQKAAEADINIVVVGENSERYNSDRTCGENCDRDNLELPTHQQELLEAVYASGKPVILVLLNGRPLSVTWAQQHIPAIVEAWEPGGMGGRAIAEILFGKVNPSGKLPITFPRNVGQIQTVYNHKASQYSRKFALTTTGPLYHFGYGLSYTTFEYGNPVLSKDTIHTNEAVTVSFELANIGFCQGTEIAQLYIQDEYGTVTRPVKELKGFQRITLNPGEKQRVSFLITPDKLAFFTSRKKYEVEPGSFKIMVGASSREQDLKTVSLMVK